MSKDFWGETLWPAAAFQLRDTQIENNTWEDAEIKAICSNPKESKRITSPILEYFTPCHHQQQGSGFWRFVLKSVSGASLPTQGPCPVTNEMQFFYIVPTISRNLESVVDKDVTYSLQ